MLNIHQKQLKMVLCVRRNILLSRQDPFESIGAARGLQRLHKHANFKRDYLKPTLKIVELQGVCGLPKPSPRLDIWAFLESSNQDESFGGGPDPCLKN